MHPGHWCIDAHFLSEQRPLRQASAASLSPRECSSRALKCRRLVSRPKQMPMHANEHDDEKMRLGEGGTKGTAVMAPCVFSVKGKITTCNLGPKSAAQKCPRSQIKRREPGRGTRLSWRGAPSPFRFCLQKLCRTRENPTERSPVGDPRRVHRTRDVVSFCPQPPTGPTTTWSEEPGEEG